MTIAPGSLPPLIVLTIAGFDPSSGAGATADLQVFQAHGLFGTACLTAMTVQSTMGVARVQPTDERLLDEMLVHLVSDLRPRGVKVGMLGNRSIVRVVARFLRELQSEERIPVVVDPVLQSSSGKALLDGDAIEVLLDDLLPYATCVTPNRHELSQLVKGREEGSFGIQAQANQLLDRTGIASVIVTGGENDPPSDLIVSSGEEAVWLRGVHVVTRSTHGTGCAFSSALLSRLVLGEHLVHAARGAKVFVEEALRAAPGLGSGKGPMQLSRSSLV